MPSREGSNLRPLWRFRPAVNQQKVTHGDGRFNKILIYYIQSWNVYENKQNQDTMSEPKSAVRARLKPFQQNISGFEGQFVVSGALGACFLRKFMATFAYGLRLLT
jgi:hypothetical protein